MEGELAKIIGMDGVKHDLREFYKQVKAQQELKKTGMVMDILPFNCALQGPPGTGKTMVGKVIAGLLPKLGIGNDKFAICRAGQFFASPYVNSTRESLTKFLVDEKLEGGVVFVDEAHEVQGQSHNNDEAFIKVLMEWMDDRDLKVIFGGYRDPNPKTIQKVIDQIDSGFARRMPNIFNFVPYSPEELTQIALVMMKGKKMPCPLDPNLADEMPDLWDKLFPKSVRAVNNGGLVNDMIKKLSAVPDFVDAAKVGKPITINIIEQAMRKLPQAKK